MRALRRRVLAGDRDLVQLARLDRRDGRVAEAVIGGEHALDVVVRLLEHLLEDGQRLLVVPVRHALVIDLGPLFGLKLGVDHTVIAVGKESGVVVGGRAAHQNIVALRHQSGDVFPLQLADL